MNADEKNRYFQELFRNLRHEGLTVKPETEEGLLPVELDGQRLCLALDTGAIRYWKEDVADERRSAALDRVTDIAKITSEYMRQMEAAPQLTASGLTGDYRLLAEFNDTVLAGHPSKYGIQFVTWEWVRDHTALYQGNYYGPEGGTDSFNSGLVPRGFLFTPEQLTEIYRCIHETLESEYPITDERQECLGSTAEQIERCVPGLEERVELSYQKEVALTAAETPQDCGMQFN